MTYKEQLLDPRWQKKRLEILNRDDFTCQSCHRTDRTLMIHHLYYGYGLMAWEAENENLLTLCGVCHKLWHEVFKSYHDIVIDNMKLKLKDNFITSCASTLFRDFKNLNDLIYLLWEGMDKEEELLELLREFVFSNSYDLSNLNGSKNIQCQESEA